MREKDYEQLKYILSDVSKRDEQGKQKAMGVSELARHQRNVQKKLQKNIKFNTFRTWTWKR